MDSPKRRLRLRRTTLRSLTEQELRTAQGADEVEPVSRGFTNCEFCGHTNSPAGCAQSYQGPCTYDPSCPGGIQSTGPNDPRCAESRHC